MVHFWNFSDIYFLNIVHTCYSSPLTSTITRIASSLSSRYCSRYNWHDIRRFPSGRNERENLRRGARRVLLGNLKNFRNLVTKAGTPAIVYAGRDSCGGNFLNSCPRVTASGELKTCSVELPRKSARRTCELPKAFSRRPSLPACRQAPREALSKSRDVRRIPDRTDNSRDCGASTARVDCKVASPGSRIARKTENPTFFSLSPPLSFFLSFHASFEIHGRT